ncbi:MAG: hypothetical protein ACYCS4_05400 [Acidimicrobiales bacterium]
MTASTTTHLSPSKWATTSLAPVVDPSPNTRHEGDILLRSPRRSMSGVPGVHQTCQPSAVADQIPVASLLPGNTGAFQVWGNFLRIDKLRFRPAYMRVAETRSTIGWRV